MAPDVIRLSPEVEEILRDLARRPGSSLLRVERRAVERTVLEREALARATTPGLDEAERHLVQAHREELAFVLRQAAYLKLTTGEGTGHFCFDRAVPGLQNALPDRSIISSRASAALRDAQGLLGRCDGLELLERCCGDRFQNMPSTAQLAAASHRLVPTDQARIYSSMCHLLEGRIAPAVHVLRGVVGRRGNDIYAVSSLTSISLAESLQSRFGDSIRAAEMALRADPLNLTSLLNRFWGFVDLGMIEEGLAAAAPLEALFAANPEQASTIRSIYEMRSRVWVVNPTREHRVAMAAIWPRLQAPMREVIHAVA